MSCLIIDTSRERCFLGLQAEGKIVATKLFVHLNNLSKELLPALDEFLTDQGLTLAQIELIAVGTGPGSFTGTRIGVAVGKALAFGRAIQMLAFPSPLIEDLNALASHLSSLEPEAPAAITIPYEEKH